MATLTGETGSVFQGGSGWQIEVFTIALVPDDEYTLQDEPRLDDDGDALIVVKLNGITVTKGVDYTLNGSVITWISSISLEQSDVLEVLYQTAM